MREDDRFQTKIEAKVLTEIKCSNPKHELQQPAALFQPETLKPIPRKLYNFHLLHPTFLDKKKLPDHIRQPSKYFFPS
ncbi:MAG TPA: hypothetical protein DEO71_03355 [Chryseobacterium sp.]|nr:hypothetical protein [Chryseobacterium sp.]